MLARSLRPAAIYVFAGPLLITGALADSKSSSSSSDINQQCQANALSAYNMALMQCFAIYQYDNQLNMCTNDAAASYGSAVQSCYLSASLRGGSSAVGTSGGIMRGTNNGRPGEGNGVGPRGGNGVRTPSGAYDGSNGARGRPDRPGGHDH